MEAGRINSMKIPNDPIGNRTRDLLGGVVEVSRGLF